MAQPTTADSAASAAPGPLVRQEASRDRPAGGGGGRSGGDALQAAFEPATLVYGVPIDSVRNLDITREARCVIILAAAVASLSVVHFIASLLRDAYVEGDSIMTRPDAFMELLFDLAVPACGYHGARSGSQQLVCCFCIYNFVIALTTSLSLTRLVVRVEELDGECQREANMQSRRSCETWVQGGVGRVFMMSGAICQILLGLLAFWFGYRHYQRLTRHDVTVVVPELLVSQVAPRIPGVVVGIVVPSTASLVPTTTSRPERGGAGGAPFGSREALLGAGGATGVGAQSASSPAPVAGGGYPGGRSGRPPEAARTPAAGGAPVARLAQLYLPPVVVQAPTR